MDQTPLSTTSHVIVFGHSPAGTITAELTDPSLNLQQNTIANIEVLLVGRTTDGLKIASIKLNGCVSKITDSKPQIYQTKNFISRPSESWDCNVSYDMLQNTIKLIAEGEKAETIYWTASITFFKTTMQEQI